VTWKATAARSVFPKASPTLISALARDLDQEEIQRIFDLDAQISKLEMQLAELEVKILETSPTTIVEAGRKLTFISCLMMDHNDFERDYFAFLIAEFSEIVDALGRDN
jgi:hypothetical protein